MAEGKTLDEDDDVQSIFVEPEAARGPFLPSRFVDGSSSEPPSARPASSRFGAHAQQLE